MITYGIGALHISRAAIQSLSVCWNDVFRRIYGFHRWESVSLTQMFCGQLSFSHIYNLHKWNFLCSVVSVCGDMLHVGSIARFFELESKTVTKFKVLYGDPGKSACSRRRAVDAVFKLQCMQYL